MRLAPTARARSARTTPYLCVLTRWSHGKNRYYNPPWLNLVRVDASAVEARFNDVWPPSAATLQTWVAEAAREADARAAAAALVSALPPPTPVAAAATTTTHHDHTAAMDDGRPVAIAIAEGATDWYDGPPRGPRPACHAP